jgi:hypothetical protein
VAGSVHLEVSNTTLRYALTFVLEEAGYRRAPDRTAADIVIADRHGLATIPGTPVDTLVVDPVPAACQEAIDRVVEGDTRTVICSDDPEALVAAIEAARTGTVTLPSRLVEAARRAPRLPERLALTLHLVLSGCSNFHIARQLRQSESTVKRDINALLAEFGVANRTALALAAQAAGFSTRTTLLAEPHASATPPAPRAVLV